MPMTPRASVEGVRWTPSSRATASPDWPDDFFAPAADMLCVAGIDGYFKALNPAWTRVLGYTPEELVSRPYIDFVHPDDRAMTAAEAGNIAKGRPTARFRNRYRCVDGSYRWLSWTASAALLDGAIYASARDVTPAVEAEGVRRQAVERTGVARVAFLEPVPETVLEPVFSLHTGMVHGFEARSRAGSTPELLPDAWSAEQAPSRMSTDLEIRAVAEAAMLAAHLPSGLYLAIDVSPATLGCAELDAVLAPVAGDHLVLKIAEQAALADHALSRPALTRLRERGLRLAIDETGAGLAALTQLVELMPEFITLDRVLTRGIDSDPVKRSLLAALVRCAGDIGAALIAGGVERIEELSALDELGVEYAQGFFLGRPMALRGSATLTLPPPAAPGRWLGGLPRVVERD